MQGQNWPLLATAIQRGINAPRASSCGRLFDAVACALGIDTQRYEGEAACRLEALAARCNGVKHPVTLSVDDLALFWQQWLAAGGALRARVGVSRCAGQRAVGACRIPCPTLIAFNNLPQWRCVT